MIRARWLRLGVGALLGIAVLPVAVSDADALG